MKAANIQKHRISPIWLVPIITIAVGLWFIVGYITTQGTHITITMYNADGIVAGKTALKSRNVNIGIVENVRLSNDLQEVILDARIFHGMEDFLKPDSIFYIVKPSISTEGVSGLSTLLSGFYIEVIPGHGLQQTPIESKATNYILSGEKPINVDKDAFYVNLESRSLTSVNKGDPVLFRGLRVGTVENNNFNDEKRIMQHRIIIDNEYVNLMTTGVRFWKSSGMSFRVSPESGANFQLESIASLISGGISFDVPEGVSAGNQLNNNTSFILYDSYDEAKKNLSSDYTEFLVYFENNIRGLTTGAAVEFAGVRVGTVAKAPYRLLKINNTQSSYLIPVLIRIEPERITQISDMQLEQEIINSIESHGKIRATLRHGNLLTGNLFVDIFMDDRVVANSESSIVDGYYVIPTANTSITEIQDNLNRFLARISNIPIESILGDVTNILQNTNKLIISINKITSSYSTKTLPSDIKHTLHSINNTLQGLQSGGSLYNAINTDAQNFKRTIGELNILIENLNQKTNSLLGKPINTDPLPKKKNK